jgi:SAM-dependent methyltransferase
MTARSAPVTGALERALKLFQPSARPDRLQLRSGYLDLLEDGAKLPRPAQRLMSSRVAPPIYERIWRPLVVRALMGRDAPGQKGELRMAQEMLRLSNGDRVLDIACGTGAFSRCFADAVGDGLVVGVDISPGMMAAAVRRTKNANVAYMRADACAQPFRDGAFDAVCCFGALHLFEQPMRGLDEIARVLGPGGRVALMVTCERSAGAGSRRRFGGITFFGREQVAEELARRGFGEIDQRTFKSAQFISAVKSA